MFQNPDGVMDRIGAARFIDSCCHDQCKPTDERVNKFFRCAKSGSMPTPLFVFVARMCSICSDRSLCDAFVKEVISLK